MEDSVSVCTWRPTPGCGASSLNGPRCVRQTRSVSRSPTRRVPSRQSTRDPLVNTWTELQPAKPTSWWTPRTHPLHRSRRPTRSRTPNPPRLPVAGKACGGGMPPGVHAGRAPVQAGLSLDAMQTANQMHWRQDWRVASGHCQGRAPSPDHLLGLSPCLPCLLRLSTLCHII